MTWLLWLAVFWLLANCFIVAFMYGVGRTHGCSGNCRQGRSVCDCELRSQGDE